MGLMGLEESERFIDVSKNDYGVLTFRVLMQSGRVFPTQKLTEHVLNKKSRQRLRDVYQAMLDQDPGMES